MSKTIDDVLAILYNKAWLRGSEQSEATDDGEYESVTTHKAKQALYELFKAEVMGDYEDLSVFGNPMGITDLSVMEDYAHMKGRNSQRREICKKLAKLLGVTNADQ